jgi:hypothetical protein
MGCACPCSRRIKLTQRTWRFFFFVLAILAGFAAGLGYGWAINPVRYTSTSPETLSADYQTDYILMTAELYQAEGDLAMALARLGFLGDKNPLVMMNEAIDFAQTRQYASVDLQLMRILGADISQTLGDMDRFGENSHAE